MDLFKHALLSNHYAGEGLQREEARLLSLKLPHAGDWLNLVPSPALGLHLRPLEFTAVAKYRLGMNIYSKAGKCPACPAMSDQLGDHAMCCGTGGERISRHNGLRDAIHSTAVTAALGPSKEGRFLIPGDDRRPADVMIPHWTGGRDTALDVTVTNPLQSATVAHAATTPGFALQKIYNSKMSKAEADCRQQGIVFLPLDAESLGGWHDVAVMQLRKLASAVARQTGQEEGQASQHLFQPVSAPAERECSPVHKPDTR